MKNLLQTGDLRESAFAWHQAQQFRKNSSTWAADAGRPLLDHSSRFILAYEAIHALCVGYLYIHGLAPNKGPGHRTTVLQLAVQELGLGPEEAAEVDGAHSTRNEKTYRSPAPPVSKETAENLCRIAHALIQHAKARQPAWFAD